MPPRKEGSGQVKEEPVVRVFVLPLPNMFAAGAVYGFGWSLFDQLPFADWARFGHYVCHNLASQLG